jgi:hypothetical protein
MMLISKAMGLVHRVSFDGGAMLVDPFLFDILTSTTVPLPLGVNFSLGDPSVHSTHDKPASLKTAASTVV